MTIKDPEVIDYLKEFFNIPRVKDALEQGDLYKLADYTKNTLIPINAVQVGYAIGAIGLNINEFIEKYAKRIHGFNYTIADIPVIFWYMKSQSNREILARYFKEYLHKGHLGLNDYNYLCDLLEGQDWSKCIDNDYRLTPFYATNYWSFNKFLATAFENNLDHLDL